MRQVSNKQTVLLLRQAIKCVDRLLMDHGSRTAYILYKMLQADGNYEMYEMADYSIFATFHDIGAYRTEELEDMMKFETKSYMPHSVYGYIMMRELSPFSEEAKILLYHHVNCDQYKKINYHLKNIASYIYLADRLDIYYLALGVEFDIHTLRQYEGTRYTKEALDLLEKAAENANILKNLQEESYQKELDELLDYLVINNEDEKKYIQLMMYCLGFANPRYSMETAMCIMICDEIAQRMHVTLEQREKLKYAALIHDMGMILLPQEIIDAPRKLTKSEMLQMDSHTVIIDKQLRKILSDEIVDIAMSHHERGNGSGYPKHLKMQDMNLSQSILQVADMVTALSSKRSYRPAKDEKEIEKLLLENVENKGFSGEVVRVFTRNSKDILKKVHDLEHYLWQKHDAIEENYDELHSKYVEK